MVYRKNPEDLLVRINVQLTVRQIEFLDQLSPYGRSAVLRKLINDLMTKQQVQVEEDVDEERNEDHILDFATPADFEITYDAYAPYLKDELLDCFNDGQDVRYLVPAFSRFLREHIGKQAHPTHIIEFLDRKMRELGNTNLS